MGAPATGKSTLLQQLRQNCTLGTDKFEIHDAVNGKMDRQPSNSNRYFPTAFIDFAAQPVRYQRPQDPLFGLLMLRNELAKFHIHFAFFDFACLIYLHKTAQLTPERIRYLFPIEERGFIFKLAGLIEKVPFGKIKNEVFNVISHSYRKHNTPYIMHRNADSALCEKIQTMQAENELLDELAVLFADELKTEVKLPLGSRNIALFFDSLEAFNENFVSEKRQSHERITNSWVRIVVQQLQKAPGITVVLASRNAPDRQYLHSSSKSQKVIRLFNLEYFTEKESDDLFTKKEISNPAFRHYFKQWAVVKHNRFNPLV
ncbi:MAG: hypothetical protein ACE5I1_12360, partial [bacterium]